MLELRNNPVQERIEMNGNIRSDISYNIIYPKIIEMNYKY